MNPIILPKKIINKDIDYLIEIYNTKIINFNYKIDKRNINYILNNIKNNNNYFDSNQIQKNFIYLLIKLFVSNSLENPLSPIDGGIPNDGIEFINKKTYEGLGIYHCHISNIDKSVLIWYIEFIKNEILLKFEYYSPHPDDNYREVINKIYNNTNSFNLKTGEYLYDNKKNLYEKFILNFNNYINFSYK